MESSRGLSGEGRQLRYYQETAARGVRSHLALLQCRVRRDDFAVAEPTERSEAFFGDNGDLAECRGTKSVVVRKQRASGSLLSGTEIRASG